MGQRLSDFSSTLPKAAPGKRLLMNVSRYGHAGVILAVIIATVVGSIPALANPPASGCKFPGSNPTIQYRYYSVESQQITAHSSGAGRWNSSAAAGSFASTTGSDPEIKVYDGEYAFDGVAVTGGSCTGGNWTNDVVSIRYDVSKMTGYSATGRRLIATHELGYAYGLAHQSFLTCLSGLITVMNPTAVWAYSNCGTSAAPYPPDVDAVNDIY